MPGGNVGNSSGRRRTGGTSKIPKSGEITATGMREYRKQLREIRVTDQSSIIDCGSGSICGPLVKAVPETPPVEELHDPPKAKWRERFSRIICIICGRGGRFVAALIRRE